MQFPKRPRNHELDELSERFFRQVMPEGWIAEKPLHDYGVDLRVDLFENGAATGLELLVQLKASEGPSEAESESVRLNVATYNLLFSKLQVVMLIKYVQAENEAYWLMLKDVTAPAQDQKSFSVRIPRSNRLSSIPWQEIRDHIFHVTDRKLAAMRSNQVSSGFVGITYVEPTPKAVTDRDIGNEKVWGHGLHVAFQSTEGVFDSHVSFQQSSKFQWSEVHVPDSVIDFFQANVLAHAGDRDIDPLLVPADAAVGTDVAHLEAVRIFQRR